MRKRSAFSTIALIAFIVVFVFIMTNVIKFTTDDLLYAKKRHDELQYFYILDEKAEEFLYELDQILADAEALSVDFISNQAYKNPVLLKQYIKDEPTLALFEKQQFAALELELLLNKIYIQEIIRMFPKIIEKYPYMLYNETSLRFNTSEVNGIDIELDFSEDTFEDKLHLFVTVIPILYDIKIENEVIEGTRLDGIVRRYKVMAWNFSSR